MSSTENSQITESNRKIFYVKNELFFYQLKLELIMLSSIITYCRQQIGVVSTKLIWEILWSMSSKRKETDEERVDVTFPFEILRMY